MDLYRELNVELPKDIESVKEGVHRFAKDVLRPAAVKLDRMTDPRDVIALDSPLRSVLKQAYQWDTTSPAFPRKSAAWDCVGSECMC